MTEPMEPRRYSAIETLRDGRQIEIRAQTPADVAELRAAMGRMSDESVYRRFFQPKRHFSEREVAFYLNVDFVTHVALVAAVSEGGQSKVVGGARYVVERPGAAELAFAVEDAFQGCGIGPMLLRHLCALGRNAGISEFYAEVLSQNMPMLKVFEKSGLRMSDKREHDTTHVTLRLT